MSTALRSLVFVISTIFLLACENSTPKVVGVPPTEGRRSEGTGVTTFNPAVDVLFVIDDSLSMATHQKNLRNNVNLFTSGLVSNKFVDYHIGVISTTTDLSPYSQKGGGALVGRTKIVDRMTSDGDRILQDNILVGTGGSGTEMIFDPIQKALTEPIVSQQNFGFYRPKAFLAVVFITDAEDQSVNLDASKAYQFLLDLKKGDASKILTYGVIIPTEDLTGCTRDGGNDTPLRIEEFFRLTLGKYYGLCDSDYGTRLSQIGADLVQRIGRAVPLDRVPQLDTVEVVYGNQVIKADANDGWSYSANENSIVLGSGIDWSEQPEGTTIEVYFKPIQKN